MKQFLLFSMQFLKLTTSASQATAPLPGLSRKNHLRTTYTVETMEIQKPAELTKCLFYYTPICFFCSKIIYTPLQDWYGYR